MDFINEKFDAALKELTETKKEKENLKKEVRHINEKNKLIEDKVQQLERKVAILTNQQLSKNLEISGIPCQPKEDCASIALKVARKIHPQIQEDEIAEAYRVGRQKDEQGKERLNRSILVKFRSLTTRDIIFKNKKSIKELWYF